MRRILTVLVLVAAGVLALGQYAPHLLPGCSSVGCLALKQTRWAFVFGRVPVVFLAAAVYAAALVAWWGGWTTTARYLAGVILGSAAWFSLLQGVLGLFCASCSLIHALAVTGALLILTDQKVGKTSMPRGVGKRRTGWVYAGSLATVVALAGMQALGPQPLSHRMIRPDGDGAEHFFGRGASGALVLTGATGTDLVLDENPALGDVSVPASECRDVVYFYDWTCSVCNEVHRSLHEALAAPTDALRGVVIHLVPGFTTPEGRELQRLFLISWLVDPNLYRTLSREVLEGKLPPIPEALTPRIPFSSKVSPTIRARAEEMLRQAEALTTRSRAAQVPGALFPRLIRDDAVLVGVPSKSDLLDFFAAARPVPGAVDKPTLAKPATPPIFVSEPSGSPQASLRDVTLQKEFGPLERGQSMDIVLQLKNPTGGAVEIYAVRPSCGCTLVGEYSKSIPSGETVSLHLTFNSKGMEAKTHRKTVMIEHSKSDPPIVLSFAVRVVEPAQKPAVPDVKGGVPQAKSTN